MGGLSKLFKAILDDPSLLKDVDRPPPALTDTSVECFICHDRRYPDECRLYGLSFVCYRDIDALLRQHILRIVRHNDAIAACKKDGDSVG